MFKLKSLPITSFFLLIAATSCSSSDEQDHNKTWRNQKGEYVYRKHNESHTIIPPQEKNLPKTYPWNKDKS